MANERTNIILFELYYLELQVVLNSCSSINRKLWFRYAYLLGKDYLTWVDMLSEFSFQTSIYTKWMQYVALHFSDVFMWKIHIYLSTLKQEKAG